MDAADALGVSTRWNIERTGGLPYAVDEILAMGRGLMDAPLCGPPAIAAAARRLAAARGRCAAVVVPPWGDASPTTDGDAAIDHVRAVLKGAVDAARVLQSDTIVLPVGRVPGVVVDDAARSLDRALADDDGEAAAAARSDLRDALSDGRERAAEVACRVLHPLVRAEPSLRWALLVEDDPRVLIDPETMDWFKDALGRGVGLWYDVASGARMEARGLVEATDWTSRFGSAILGAWLSDVSGPRRGLPPGTGEVDWTAVRSELPRNVPRLIDIDPTLGSFAVGEALTLLA